MNTVYTETHEEPPINKKEILRYAGVKVSNAELEALVDDCINEARSKFTYKTCCCEFEIKQNGEVLDVGFTKTYSKDLKKNLSGCTSIVLFAATVGIEIDRLIARYAAISPTKSLIFQAMGTERIESLCDVFNDNITRQNNSLGLLTRPRFSAGYGDFPIEVQREIFDVLDCSRKIGLTLNDSLLMSPSKSVTALIGISDKKCFNGNEQQCSVCNQHGCIYREKHKGK